MIDEYRKALAGMNAQDSISWAVESFGPEAVFTTSLGAEDQVILDILAKAAPAGAQIPLPRIVSLDTGRLHQESYEVLEMNRQQYPWLPIEIFFPQHLAVEELHRRHGSQAFRNSIELRKKCCAIRKLEPLGRALKGAKMWISGLRRDQSVTREELELVSWDPEREVYKLAPLWNWNRAEVFSYLDTHQVPRNALHAQGFPSIGCAPCTRAIKPGEDERAGRWWWENPEQKECGLHGNTGNGTKVSVQTLSLKD